jgi:hypothetical protein
MLKARVAQESPPAVAALDHRARLAARPTELADTPANRPGLVVIADAKQRRALARRPCVRAWRRCSGRRQSERAARSHARQMRSAPWCRHNEKIIAGERFDETDDLAINESDRLIFGPRPAEEHGKDTPLK